MIGIIYFFAFLVIGFSLSYLYLLALASVRVRTVMPGSNPNHRFAIAIPAHNESLVIERTVISLRKLLYPPDLFDIFVVADHCSDDTAEIARIAGAIVYERNEGPRGSKGAALQWLFARILDLHDDNPYDAIVIFDADTIVDPLFLSVMDVHLSEGTPVIQGQHCISNPHDGWFPTLTWAMFIIDNRFQNLGRSNLGWSAKNMGDSICFRSDIIRIFGWGEGLTEDYAFRLQLLLAGIKIKYEPNAIGYGEAPISWDIARSQRERWLRGSHDASKQYARHLLKKAFYERDMASLDGALQSYLPSFSTLTLISAILFVMTWISNKALDMHLSSWPWIVALIMLLLYPYLGLMLEHAPMRAYLVMMSGPIFILWRTWLAFSSRFQKKSVKWIRTPRRAQ